MVRPDSQCRDSHRVPKSLSAKLSKGLLSYVTAASAAGGMLVQPAHAEVVYTPANTPIQVNVPLPLDLNNDGTTDFTLNNNFSTIKEPVPCSAWGTSTLWHAWLEASPAQADNAIWGVSSSVLAHPGKRQGTERNTRNQNSNVVATPALWGVVNGPGPGRNFKRNPLVMHSLHYSHFFFGGHSTRTYGLWARGIGAAGPYLGFRFMIGSEVHNGWARVSVQANFLTITATLTGYAYETIPNRPILTGFTRGSLDESTAAEAATQEEQGTEPATLGRLAQGAAGLPTWRGN